MTCMAEAGRQDREKLNMVVNGQSDEVGLFFVRFFWCCHVSGGRDGSSERKLRSAWERREERNMRRREGLP